MELVSLVGRLARVGEAVPSQDDFFEYIFLIRCVHEMDIEYVTASV